MRRAGVWIRAAALAIDAVIAIVIATTLAAGVYFLVAEAGSEALADYLFEVIWLGLLLSYTSLEVWPGRTPGKMLLGLRTAYPDGATADRWTLLLRWSTKWFAYLATFASAITLHATLLEALAGFMNGVILVGCLQALDEDRRAWHDQWSRTAVFRRPRRQPDPATVPPPLPVAA